MFLNSTNEERNNCHLFERLFKIKMNGIFLFGIISFFIFEIFTFFNSQVRKVMTS